MKGGQETEGKRSSLDNKIVVDHPMREPVDCKGDKCDQLSVVLFRIYSLSFMFRKPLLSPLHAASIDSPVCEKSATAAQKSQ